MKVTKRQLRRIIKEERRKVLREGNLESAMYDRRAEEQGIPVQQGTKEAARGARGAFNQLINLLVQAQEKAAEMNQLATLPGAGDSMAHAFGGSEAGEIAGELERVWEAAGFTADGSTLKDFL